MSVYGTELFDECAVSGKLLEGEACTVAGCEVIEAATWALDDGCGTNCEVTWVKVT